MKMGSKSHQKSMKINEKSSKINEKSPKSTKNTLYGELSSDRPKRVEKSSKIDEKGVEKSPKSTKNTLIRRNIDRGSKTTPGTPKRPLGPSQDPHFGTSGSFHIGIPTRISGSKGVSRGK
jgi:hypothetical protein